MAVFNFLGGTWSATSSWAGGVVPTNGDNQRVIFSSTSGNCIIDTNLSIGGWRFDGTTASTDNQFDNFAPHNDYYAGLFDFSNRTVNKGANVNTPWFWSPNMSFKHGSTGIIQYFNGPIRSNGMTHSFRFTFVQGCSFVDDFLFDVSAGIDTLPNPFTLINQNGLSKSTKVEYLPVSKPKIQFNFGGASQSSMSATTQTWSATFDANQSLGDNLDLILGPHNGSINFNFIAPNLSTNNPTDNSFIIDGGTGTYSSLVIGRQPSTFRQPFGGRMPKHFVWKSGNWSQSSNRFQLGGSYEFFIVNQTSNKMIIKTSIIENSGNSSTGPVNFLGDVNVENLSLEPGVEPNSGGFGRLIIGSGTSSIYTTASNVGLSASIINFSSYGNILNNDISTSQLYIQRGGTVSVDYISSNFQYSNTLGANRRHEINVNSTPASGATPSFIIRNNPNVIMNMNVLNVDLSGGGTLYGLTAVSFTASTGNYQLGLPSTQIKSPSNLTFLL